MAQAVQILLAQAFSGDDHDDATVQETLDANRETFSRVVLGLIVDQANGTALAQAATEHMTNVGAAAHKVCVNALPHGPGQ